MHTHTFLCERDNTTNDGSNWHRMNIRLTLDNNINYLIKPGITIFIVSMKISIKKHRENNSFVKNNLQYIIYYFKDVSVCILKLQV